jgi:multiple sugar transport system substrate-binding protein
MDGWLKAGKVKVNRRTFLKAVGGTAAAVGLAGRAKWTSAAAAPRRGLTLRALVYAWPPTVAVRNMLPEYEKLTGVRVEWEEVGYNELLGKMMMELVTKAGRYDILVPNNFWNGQLAATENVEVLDDYIAKAGATLDYDDFLPAAREQYVYQGKVYQIPQSLNTYVCCWRKDVFEQEGIKPPADGIFTAQEWSKLVKQLTKGGKYGTTFATKNPNTRAGQDWSNVLMTTGGRYFDENMNPVFNSKEGLLAANYWNDLLPACPPDQLSYGHVESNESMARGLSLTITSQSAGRIPMIADPKKSTVSDKVAWGLLPHGGLAPSKFRSGQSYSDGFGFLIPKDSKNKKDAWEFCVWAVGKDKQVGWAEIPVLPSRKSVFTNPDLLKRQPWLDVIRRQLENTYVFPQIPETTEILDRIGTELVGAYGKQSTTKEALDRVTVWAAQHLKDRGYPVGTWKGSKLPWA